MTFFQRKKNKRYHFVTRDSCFCVVNTTPLYKNFKIVSKPFELKYLFVHNPQQSFINIRQSGLINRTIIAECSRQTIIERVFIVLCRYGISKSVIFIFRIILAAFFIATNNKIIAIEQDVSHHTIY